MFLKVIIFNILFGMTIGFKCYECGFGLEIDLTAFPQIFGQDKFSFALSKQTANGDKWCGLKGQGDNSSLIECGGNCALVRSTDNMSRISGCANVNGPKIDTSFTSIRINRTIYEMFICDQDKCNESPESAQQAINNGTSKPKSSASTASFSFILFPLATFLIFYKF